MRIPRPCLLAALALASTGCDGIADYLTNRLKTCEDVRADLINSEQSRFPVYLTGPGEDRTDSTFLESGQKRSISLCLERGDAKRFLAQSSTEVVATINCVAFKASYEGSFVKVIWSPAGFICQDW
jgi:hypothetical protein